MQNGKQTQYFQYDRSISIFSMQCLENGTFDFVNDTDHWPICLEGKLLYLWSLMINVQITNYTDIFKILNVKIFHQIFQLILNTWNQQMMEK